MAQSTPLIMSISTFSIIAGILSPTHSYTYEAWIHYDQVCGLTNGKSSDHMSTLQWGGYGLKAIFYEVCRPSLVALS
jgi:hypothetical protein